MKFYASTACLKQTVPLAQRLAEYAEAGIQQVELGANVTLPTGKFSVQGLPSGLEYLIHNYFPPPAESFVLNLASADAALRRRSMELVERGLKLSAELGAPFYSVHGGFITDAASFANGSFHFPMPQAPQEAVDAMDRFVASLQELLVTAQAVKVTLLVENNVCTVENKGKLLLQNAEEFGELFRRCPSWHLKMLLDTGHLNVSATTFGFDRMKFVRSVAPHVRAFHIHDNAGQADTHGEVQTGSWVLDVLRNPEFAAADVVVESKSESAATLATHLEWLRSQVPLGVEVAGKVAR